MHTDHDIIDNPETDDSPSYFGNVLETSMTRREVMSGLTAATAVAVGSGALSACAGSEADFAPVVGVTSVSKSLADRVVVPAGYSASVLYRTGDPTRTTDASGAAVPAYRNDGTDTDFAHRAGDQHDGMYFFGMSAAGTLDFNSSARGLLCMNHEALLEVLLHPAGTVFSNGFDSATKTRKPVSRSSAQVLKETEAHGVSVVEVARGATGNGMSYNPAGAVNRRITTRTPMVLSGPVAGNDLVKHKSYTANGATYGNGISVQGTLNNCANGYTPWGTYLTCEENWAGYFFRGKADQARRDDLERYSIRTVGGTDYVGFQGLNWDTADGAEDEYKRFDCTATAATAADDFRNAPNTFGYIVEIDPFNPAAAIKKRTALGRMGHEGCWPAPAKAGQPVVFYMGDDGRFEYIYKFVSTAAWNEADRGTGVAGGDKYMDSGKLYAAKFEANGTGRWLELAPGVNGISATDGLGTVADVAIKTRRAADIAGATSMDRPEWAAVNPLTGEVFFTLTNNTGRGNGTATELPEIYKGNKDIGPDAANPRAANAHGHVIRIREDGGNNGATSFRWEIMVFGSRSDNATTNLSELDATSDFSSPDGLWMDRNGLLWIQTDDGSNFTTGATGSATPALSNNQMLVTIPGEFGQRPTIRRFLVGPKGCEITGIDMTPDSKTMFVNIQHPGEGSFDVAKPETYVSKWPEGSNATTVPPASSTSRPRSTTVVITRNDGGMIGF